MTEGLFYHRRGFSISNLFILWTFFFYVFDLVIAQQQEDDGDGSGSDGLRNVSIASTSSEITYSPFVCNNSTSLSGSDCTGGWQVLDVDGVTVVSTDGPVMDGVNIVPQVFLRFRALSLAVTTSSLSNALINITVVTGKTVLNAVGSSSRGFAIVQLEDTETTTLEVTYVQGIIPSRLDIGDMTITVNNDSASTSIFPTQTLPPSISLPSFVPTTTASSSASGATGTATDDSGDSDRSKKKLVAHAVGLTIGLGLGLTAVTCVVYVLWRRRSRGGGGKKGESASGASGGASDMENWDRDQLPSLVGRPSVSSYRSPRTTKDYTDTRWFYR